MKPTIFFNCGWMDLYDGQADIFGGGKFVTENKTGGEIYNFRIFDGKVYGYVQPSKDKAKLALERLGAPRNADKIEGVLVIFTALDPEAGGVCVTGWYKDATLHRSYQDNKITGREGLGHYAETDHTHATLLLPDERRGFMCPPLPSRLPKGSGWKGQSNVFYADCNVGLELKKKVVDQIDTYERGMQKARKASSRKPAPLELRKEVEKVAMDYVTDYFINMNYSVTDVSEKNLGWDLEASVNNHRLRIEVKGLSGEDIDISLTRNEYEKMRGYKKDGYRIAVVTNARSNPMPYIFEFSVDRDSWWDMKNKLPLIIDETIAARCTIE